MLIQDAFPWERDGATKGEGASVLMMEMELLKMAEIDAGTASKLSVIGVDEEVTHAVAANVQDIAAALKAAAGRDSDSDEAAAPPVLGEEPSSWMSSSGAKMAAALGNLGQGSMKMLIQDTSAQLENSVTPAARLKAERAKKRWQKAIHLAGVMTKRFSLKRPDGPTIQVGSEDACAKQAGATPPVYEYDRKLMRLETMANLSPRSRQQYEEEEAVGCLSHDAATVWHATHLLEKGDMSIRRLGTAQGRRDVQTALTGKSALRKPGEQFDEASRGVDRGRERVRQGSISGTTKGDKTLRAAMSTGHKRPATISAGASRRVSFLPSSRSIPSSPLPMRALSTGATGADATAELGHAAQLAARSRSLSPGDKLSSSLSLGDRARAVLGLARLASGHVPHCTHTHTAARAPLPPSPPSARPPVPCSAERVALEGRIEPQAVQAREEAWSRREQQTRDSRVYALLGGSGLMFHPLLSTSPRNSTLKDLYYDRLASPPTTLLLQPGVGKQTRKLVMTRRSRRHAAGGAAPAAVAVGSERVGGRRGRRHRERIRESVMTAPGIPCSAVGASEPKSSAKVMPRGTARQSSDRLPVRSDSRAAIADSNSHALSSPLSHYTRLGAGSVAVRLHAQPLLSPVAGRSLEKVQFSTSGKWRPATAD